MTPFAMMYYNRTWLKPAYLWTVGRKLVLFQSVRLFGLSLRIRIQDTSKVAVSVSLHFAYSCALNKRKRRLRSLEHFPLGGPVSCYLFLLASYLWSALRQYSFAFAQLMPCSPKSVRFAGAVLSLLGD